MFQNPTQLAELFEGLLRATREFALMESEIKYLRAEKVRVDQENEQLRVENAELKDTVMKLEHERLSLQVQLSQSYVDPSQEREHFGPR